MKDILWISIVLIGAIFLIILNYKGIYSFYPTDNGGATTPSCTQADISWNCGTFGTCTGTFYQRTCCIYFPPAGFFEGGIIEATEYYYCNELNQFWNSGIEGSSYGTINIYLASSPDAGLTQAQLVQFSNELKAYLHEASYGMLNNINFIVEANADFINPNIALSRFGTEIKASYYIARNYPEVDNFNHQFNSGINWLFSSATWHAQYPWGWTTIPEGWTYGGGCSFFSGSSQLDACQTTAHELGHALFGLDDYEGNIMRPLPGLSNPNHYSPIGLEKIKYYLPQASIGSACTESWTCSAWTPSTCTSGTQTRTCTDANACGTTANKPATTQTCSTTCPTFQQLIDYANSWASC